MSWLQAVLLGLLQGLTEFLPVSSTAHMDIASQLLYHHDVGSAFSAIAQLGPIVAIIVYFRVDLGRYIRGIARYPVPVHIPPDDTSARLGWYTLLGTLPLIVFALLLEKKVDTTFRRLDVVAVALIALGLVLLLAERVGKKTKTLKELEFSDSQVIGWAQVLALIPGTSRSGVTITAALFRGFDRESAARFSFLLSIPAITLAGLYKLSKVVLAVLSPRRVTQEDLLRLHPFPGQITDDLGKYLLAAVVAGIFAYVVIRWFLSYMKENNTSVFIIYRIVLGLILLGLLATHYLQAKTPGAAETAPAKPTARISVPAVQSSMIARKVEDKR